MRFFAGISQKLSDSLNPIVIKELRQSVRSRFITGGLILFLTMFLVTCWIYLAANQISHNTGTTVNFHAGRTLFFILFGMLSYLCLIFIPLYTSVRFAFEQDKDNSELIFITTIRPSSIIRGKLFSGIVITLLMISSCMPFMSFAYLLRGIDLPSMFVIISALFILVIIIIQITLFLACVPVSKPFKILFGLASFFICFILTSVFLTMFFDSISEGIGSQLWSWEFWGPALTVLIIAFMTVYFFYHLSIALISPPSSNRSLPLRIYLTTAWLTGCAISVFWSLKLSRGIPFIFISTIGLCFAILVCVSQNDRVSIRVQRTIPHSKWLRPIAFLFYNSSAGGITWILVMFLAVLSFSLIMSFIVPHISFWEGAERSLISFLYIYSYAITGALIQRKLFAGRIPRKNTWAIALMLIAVGSVFPSIRSFFMNIPLKSIWQYGNIFADFDKTHLYFAGFWAATMSFLCFFWYIRQVKNFRPYTEPAKKSE